METSVKMYNSLDPSQVLTIEHLESLVNVQHVQPTDARMAKRPRLDDKENVPIESPFVNQLKSILNRNLSECPTRYETTMLMKIVAHLQITVNCYNYKDHYCKHSRKYLAKYKKGFRISRGDACMQA